MVGGFMKMGKAVAKDGRVGESLRVKAMRFEG